MCKNPSPSLPENCFGTLLPLPILHGSVESLDPPYMDESDPSDVLLPLPPSDSPSSQPVPFLPGTLDFTSHPCPQSLYSDH